MSLSKAIANRGSSKNKDVAQAESSSLREVEQQKGQLAKESKSRESSKARSKEQEANIHPSKGKDLLVHWGYVALPLPLKDAWLDLTI